MEDAVSGYAADPDFAGSPPGRRRAGPCPARVRRRHRASARSLAVAREALAQNGLVSHVEGNLHYAAYPASYGKAQAVAGAVVMAWDLSIHSAEIVAPKCATGSSRSASGGRAGSSRCC